MDKLTREPRPDVEELSRRAVKDALLLIDSIFKQAIAREKTKQAEARKAVRGE